MTNRTNVNNGIATLTVHDTLQPGTYTITGHYNGTDNYTESEGTAELEVLKKSTSTTISSTKQTYTTTEDIIINIQVKDTNNTNITTGTYKLYENNTQKSTGVINGNSISVNIGKKTSGTNTYKVVYQENETYLGSTSNELEITVTKESTTIEILSANLYVNGKSVIYGQLLDSNNNPVSNVKTVARIGGTTVKDENGKVMYIKTDEYGEAEHVFTKTGLNSSTSYKVRLTSIGNSNYDTSNSIEEDITPAASHPEITSMDDFIVDQDNEEGTISFQVDFTTDATNDFLFMKTFLDNYLENNVLLLVASGDTDFIGYAIGADPEDSSIITEITNSGVANEYYCISNYDFGVDGTFEGIMYNGDNSCSLNVDIHLEEGTPLVEDVVLFDIYLFGTGIYISYEAE